MRQLILLLCLISAIFASSAEAQWTCQYDGANNTIGDDALLVGTGATYATEKVLTDCNAAGQCVQYDTATNTFSCTDLSGSLNPFGSSIDDTELTNEDYGEFTCNGSENGCTLDAESQTLEEASDVDSGAGTGDILTRIGSAWTPLDAAAIGVDTDTSLRSTTTTFAAITGLSDTVTVTTRHVVFAWAQLTVSAAATTSCGFYINQNLGGVDTNISVANAIYHSTAGAATDGAVDTITVIGAVNPTSDGTATYSVYWAETASSTCYSLDKALKVISVIDE